MKRQFRRRALVLLAVLGAFSSVLLVGGDKPSVKPAADVSQFQAGNIISDAVFFNGQTMSADDIQGFLTLKGASCRPSTIDGSPCLKDYRQDTVTKPADSYCTGTYGGGSQETAATIIAKVALACGISPRVLLVTLQKEQGLVTSSGGANLSANKYRIAMGYGCPDTAACDTQYYGFQNQLYNAARQFKLYAARPGNYAYQAGRWNNILWNPNTGCGSAPVYIQNQATAGLYNYTPYQPNQAALNAGYGTGDGCSSYGNRNFWLYFTDWFGSTQTDSAIASMPKGTMDGATSSYGQIRAGGWAFDPDRPTNPIDVHVYVDGQPYISTTANGERDDVGAAFPGVGNYHGWTVVFTAPLGQHQVCAYAINQGAGTVNPQIGCLSVDNQDPGAPIGHLDDVSAVPGGISVAGWAYDPDTTTAPLTISVTADGRPIGTITASDGRPDVGTAYGIDPNHGFHGRLDLGMGSHNICLTALNVGLGTHDTSLGCRTVSVADPASFNPIGVVENVSVLGRTVSVEGWTVDPDVLTTPSTVHIYVDGVFKTAITADGTRPDLAAAWPAAGADHGYAWSGTLSPGSHQVCLYAINQGVGTQNPLLGCRGVRTTEGNPFGSVDAVTSSQGNLSLSGWAVDPDAPTSPVTVHVYVDGKVVLPLVADLSRPDVAAAFPGVGDAHGYSWTTTDVAPGVHQVCLFAINIGAGTVNPLLGCRTVTVEDVRAQYNPVGRLDAATVSSGTLTVSGWAYDPDQPTSPIVVHIYVDGVVRTGIWADQPRPDVGAAVPGIGNDHGYSWSGPLSSGTHTVCTFGINVGRGTQNPLLGCGTVRVP